MALQRRSQWPSREAHILFSGICKYATLRGRQTFADVIKVKEFEMEQLSWIIGMG